MTGDQWHDVLITAIVAVVIVAIVYIRNRYDNDGES